MWFYNITQMLSYCLFDPAAFSFFHSTLNFWDLSMLAYVAPVHISYYVLFYCVNKSLFIYLPTHGLFNCFYFIVITSNAWRYICLLEFRNEQCSSSMARSGIYEINTLRPEHLLPDFTRLFSTSSHAPTSHGQRFYFWWLSEKGHLCGFNVHFLSYQWVWASCPMSTAHLSFLFYKLSIFHQWFVLFLWFRRTLLRIPGYSSPISYVLSLFCLRYLLFCRYFKFKCD